MTLTPPIRAPNLRGALNPSLNERELDVLRLVTEGLTNQEIGDRLEISRHTVKNHLYRIYACMVVRNRVEAVILALDQGIVDFPMVRS